MQPPFPVPAIDLSLDVASYKHALSRAVANVGEVGWWGKWKQFPPPTNPNPNTNPIRNLHEMAGNDMSEPLDFTIS